MSHIDPDVLALLALGEEVASPEELGHLTACAECRDEVAVLSRAATVGRATIGTGDLLEPAPRVWARIAEELELTPAVAGGFGAPSRAVTAAPADPSASADPVAPARPVAVLRRRRWLLPTAIAASVAVVAAGVFGVWELLRPARPDVLATAELDPFPDWQGAAGTATLEETANGERMVSVRFSAPADPDGYREIWLITSDATELVSLGIVEGDSGTFAVPAGIDTDRYDLVDISEEPLDGDPSHSGDSIVRGQLRAS
ncbi:anti-sigma factor [Naasia aerilata]|uniref:Anti-sigma K factor RskA C-terminal domain-containing protein n=1 Tax=Naasia aerilata TaxID=1162966 RepID=A0ABM8GEG8_9MICO|nr:anti-sigma factor [Naasia aerilata]BDZ46699.1 hypothetical protein GCM10025866_26080 [Naasia aerilata]